MGLKVRKMREPRSNARLKFLIADERYKERARKLRELYEKDRAKWQDLLLAGYRPSEHE